jgi:hypothetical protein
MQSEQAFQSLPSRCPNASRRGHLTGEIRQNRNTWPNARAIDAHYELHVELRMASIHVGRFPDWDRKVQMITRPAGAIHQLAGVSVGCHPLVGGDVSRLARLDRRTGFDAACGSRKPQAVNSQPQENFTCETRCKAHAERIRQCRVTSSALLTQSWALVAFIARQHYAGSAGPRIKLLPSAEW